MPKTSPLEPIFLSLTHSSALTGLDLITDRNNLRKLFSFLGTPPASRDALEWRIDAECVGRTVLFTRWERNSVRKPGGAAPNRGWRYEFHATATESARKGAERSEGCHRLVRYCFGGMNVLVRFEIDASLPTESEQQHAGEESGKRPDEQSLNNLMNSLVIDRSPETPLEDSPIRIIPSNLAHPPQSSLIEIKTRKWTRALDPTDTYGQLVFSQTPHLFVGRHKDGDFGVAPIDKLDLDGEEMVAVGREQRGVMEGVRGMLEQMMEVVRERGRVSFVCREGGIAVYKREEGGARLSGRAEKMIMEANGCGTGQLDQETQRGAEV